MDQLLQYFVNKVIFYKDNYEFICFKDSTLYTVFIITTIMAALSPSNQLGQKGL